MLQLHDWKNVYNVDSSDEKTQTFHKEVMEIVNKIAPEKLRNVSSDNQPWFTEQLKTLDRKRRREYQQNRRSDKYSRLQKEYKIKCSKAKKEFFNKLFRQFRESDPSKWYSLLKRITKYNVEKIGGTQY